MTHAFLGKGKRLVEPPSGVGQTCEVVKEHWSAGWMEAQRLSIGVLRFLETAGKAQVESEEAQPRGHVRRLVPRPGLREGDGFAKGRL